jgi:hypothetical protein
LANVLSISVTYHHPTPGPGGDILYRFTTGISLGNEVGPFLPYWQGGDTTVGVPPHHLPSMYNINVFPGDDGQVSLTVGLNGRLAFSRSFNLNEIFQETKSVALHGGELTISAGTGAQFQSL